MDIPTIDIEKTGQNIKRLRTQANMSARDLSNIFGFTRPTAVYHWEKGLKIPSLDNLVILAKVFGVTMDEIIVCKGV